MRFFGQQLLGRLLGELSPSQLSLSDFGRPFCRRQRPMNFGRTAAVGRLPLSNSFLCPTQSKSPFDLCLWLERNHATAACILVQTKSVERKFGFIILNAHLSKLYLVDVTGDLNFAHLTGGIHTRGFVHRVAPNVEHGFTGANDSAH